MVSRPNTESDYRQKRLDLPRWLVNDITAGDPAAADLLTALVETREQQRDAAFSELDKEAKRLIRKLRETTHHLLLEELACFKDILVLQRKLDDDNKGPNRTSRQCR